MSVTCLATLPPTADNQAFCNDTYWNATLYVTEGSLEAYQTTRPWYCFNSIKPLPEGLPGDVNGDDELNVADVNALIDMILSGDQDTFCDVNNDGEVNIADVNTLIDFIMAKN